MCTLIRQFTWAERDQTVGCEHHPVAEVVHLGEATIFRFVFAKMSGFRPYMTE
jgi:hypothetical protein